MKPVLLLLAFFIVACHGTAQTTWYVRASASPVGADGASWATATPFLQDALQAAQPGDVIWIAEGMYKPSLSGDRYISFDLKNDLRLYGGFAGTETDPGQRDWENHPTILSGDIGAPGVSADNSFCLMNATRTSIGTRVDGIVFEDASASHPDNINVLFFEQGHSGSAIYLNGQNLGNFAYLTIQNCTFRRNWSDFYGAVYANGRNGGKSGVLVENCRFYDNNCGGGGGGLAVDNDVAQSQVTVIRGSVFQNNYAYSRGGGLLLGHHADVTVQECVFMRDSVRFHAGAAVCIEGDYINALYRFENCLFDQNRLGQGAAGGAIVVEPNYSNLKLSFQNCIFSRHKGLDVIWNPSLFGTVQNTFQNCIFENNDVYNLIYHQTLGVTGTQQFLHCLFYGTTGAEVLDYYDNNDQINHRFQNCLIIKNPANVVADGNPNVTLDHCMVSHGDCAALGPGVTCGAGMHFAQNLTFADPANGDFHLTPCSPAINAGDNLAAQNAGLLADAAGQQRILNGMVDLGPYEHDIFLGSLVISPASCPDTRDGAIALSGYFCPPLTFSWDNGAETGARTDSLAAGTYVFSFTDASGYAETDTLIVPALPPVVVLPLVTEVTCFGLSNGAAGLDISGGTPPYQIAWANGNTSGYLFNLPAGDYAATVTDAKGCTAAEVVTVSDPGLIQVFYTVTPASAPGKADGRIHIDSVVGCQGPFLWPGSDLSQLSPGTYAVTVTDPCGCVLVLPISVGVATSAGDTPGAFSGATLWPNPVRAGQTAVLRCSPGKARTILIQDASGHTLEHLQLPPGAEQLDIRAPRLPGVYWLTLLDGPRGLSLRWVVH